MAQKLHERREITDSWLMKFQQKSKFKNGLYKNDQKQEKISSPMKCHIILTREYPHCVVVYRIMFHHSILSRAMF